MDKNLNFIDLFAGCGGFSLGLEFSGFTPIFVNEISNEAMMSYLINRKNEFPHLLKNNCNDIKEIVCEDGKYLKTLIKNFKKDLNIDVKNGDIDLIVGGPPCQGFSDINHRRLYSVEKKQLPSNFLYQDMAWIIKQLQPKIFLFENVRGLIASKWTKNGKKGEIWEDVQKTFFSLGNYKIESSLVFARDYGVAQRRPRILLVGVRDDLDISKWENSNIANGFLPSPTFGAPDLENLLGDLVDVNYVNGGQTLQYPNEVLNDIQKFYRTDKKGNLSKKGSGLTEHKYSRHTSNIEKKFEFMLQNNGNISKNFQTKKFQQRLLPKVWNGTGPNITATSLPDDFVHFSQPRVLTVREWARLQGFPDWYEFHGKRTTGGIRRAGNPRVGNFDRELPKYTQIGNAVPVQLATAIGEHFKKVL